MSFHRLLVDDDPHYSTPVAVYGLPGGVTGGRELSFSTSFGEAMSDFIEGDDYDPPALTVSSRIHAEGDDRQNAEEPSESPAKKTLAIRDLIVTDVTPPAADLGTVKSMIDDMPKFAEAEYNADADPDEEDEESFGLVDNLGDGSPFYDIGFSVFTDQRDVD
jgi:hypothetical protein